MLARKLLSLLCVLFSIVYANQISAAEWRAGEQANSSTQTSPFVLPIAKRDSLLNGLQLIVMEAPGSGQVTAHIRINSGGVFDLSGKAGLADITARLLIRGGGGFSAKNVAETIDQFGLNMSVSVGWDTTDLIVSGPAQSIDAIFDLLNRVVVSPAFDQKELDALKTERAAAAAAESADENQKLRRKAMEALYGSHPYGRALGGTAESVAQVARADVLSFYSRFYLANNAELLVFGDTSAEQVTKQARAKLGTWRKGEIVPLNFRPPEKLSGNRTFLVDRNGGDGRALFAMSGVSRRSQDYFAAAMAVAILNQAFSQARLSAVAHLEARMLSGPVLVELSAAPDKLGEQLNAVSGIMAHLQTDGPASGQVEVARASLVDTMGQRLHSNGTSAEVILDIETYGLGRDYVLNFARRVGTVSAEDIQGAARAYFQPQAMVVVLSGPASVLEPDARRFGSVTVIR